jgi:hypothetical protein
MLYYHLDVVLKCFLAFWVFVTAIAYSAYKVNSHRTAENPKKRDFQPAAIVLAPIVFLIVVPLAISLFVFLAVLYGVFLIFFALLLVAFRRPFIFIWWNKFASWVGEPLLRTGTYLILLPFRLIRPPRGPGQQPVPA